MVTITSFSSLSGALALKEFLEAREIPVFLPDEFASLSGWNGPTPESVPLNSIRVQVPSSYETRAARATSEFFR